MQCDGKGESQERREKNFNTIMKNVSLFAPIGSHRTNGDRSTPTKTRCRVVGGHSTTYRRITNYSLFAPGGALGETRNGNPSKFLDQSQMMIRTGVMTPVAYRYISPRIHIQH
eukprot:scaffold421529_cov71-Attheya_sp.AAC.3